MASKSSSCIEDNSAIVKNTNVMYRWFMLINIVKINIIYIKKTNLDIIGLNNNTAM